MVLLNVRAISSLIVPGTRTHDLDLSRNLKDYSLSDLLVGQWHNICEEIEDLFIKVQELIINSEWFAR